MTKREDDRSIVFFDFDGVIVDSLKHAVATSRTLEPELTEESFIERFMGNIMHHPAIKKWGPEFQATYSAGVPDQPLFPGMREVIEEATRDYLLFIVSASLTTTIRAFLDRHHLTKHFADLLGSDIHASKHVKMEQALWQHNVPANHAVMVTDTLGDLREAKAAKVKTIAVAWGFHDLTTLQQGNPTHIADLPAQLPQLIRSVLDPDT